MEGVVSFEPTDWEIRIAKRDELDLGVLHCKVTQGLLFLMKDVLESKSWPEEESNHFWRLVIRELPFVYSSLLCYSLFLDRVD